MIRPLYDTPYCKGLDVVITTTLIILFIILLFI